MRALFEKKLNEYKKLLNQMEINSTHASIDERKDIDKKINEALYLFQWKLKQISIPLRSREDTIEIKKELGHIEVAINKFDMLPNDKSVTIDNLLGKYNKCVELMEAFEIQRLSY